MGNLSFKLVIERLKRCTKIIYSLRINFIFNKITKKFIKIDDENY